MLGLAILFFIIALIAYVFGANGVAGMSADIGKLLLAVFVILAVLAVVCGWGLGWGWGFHSNVVVP